MKVARCVLARQAIQPDSIPIRSYEVWANDDAEIGDVFNSAPLGMVKVIGFTGVTNKPETPKIKQHQTIPSMELEINDEFLIDNGWARVTGVNKTQGTYYMYVDAVSLETGRKMPSQKIPKKSMLEIRPREQVMSMTIITSHELIKQLQAKLIDYQALNDAPQRIEILPTVFIDKTPAMSALKSEIKALENKLGEMIKKL